MITKTISILVFTLPSFAFAQTADVNPFSTPPSVVSSSIPQVSAPTSLDGFEFNGIMEMRGKVRISIYDTNEKRNYWITEGTMAPNGVSFQRFDDENKTVVIAQGGVSKKLALNQAKIEPLTRIASKTGPTIQLTQAAIANPVKASSNSESDEEARIRIQRVAEEIRQRRAERRQQLEQSSRGRTN